jgi:hypothetical protein
VPASDPPAPVRPDPEAVSATGADGPPVTGDEARAAVVDDATAAPAAEHRPEDETPAGFLSAQPRRQRAESVFVRLVATAGVIAVGTALGAILVANGVDGWIVGLAVSAVSVLFAAVLWRSRQL